ncbi:MAG: HD domain-containing phosphohydrolase [Candidatus Omnitrophota bacterium]|jgi:HAMP domain-containing protein/HD superfamily phosphohydrolase YqeK
MKGKALFYSFRTRVTLVLILAMVTVTGLNNFFVYRFNLASSFEQLRNSLIVIAKTASLAVDTETLQKIPLTQNGVQSSAYREVAAKLDKVLEMNKPLQYIYVLAKTKTPGNLQFLIDTETSGGEAGRKRGSARPGDFYDASRFPEMLEGFNAPSADHELQTDPWGVTLSGYAPVLGKDGKTVAILGVDILADDIGRMQQEIKRRMVVVLLSGCLFCCLLGILIAGSVSNPVRRLTEGTRQLAGGNLDYRVKVRSRDEIGELADSFNKMAASLSESRQRLQNYFFKVTQSLVRALEAKDPYTRGHSERVADLARKIALELGVGPQKAELIGCAAELHDIGKLVIHETILNKKEKLDPGEWEILKEHPVTGEKILKPVLDEDLLHVIRSHHERVDGKGYPDGLRDEAINMPSQIVSVADAYDAMTSLRSYREPLTPGNAVSEIERASGTQFRPEVVRAFLKVIGRAA